MKCQHKLAAIVTAIILLFLSLQCQALRSQVTIILYNCIPGKTLYPRIYAANMAGQPGGNNVIKGPPVDAKLGTCGEHATLTSGYEDKGWGNLYWGAHGIVIITGINGDSLIYHKNDYTHDPAYYPDEKTQLPYEGTDWLYGDAGGVAFISNQHYKDLPYGVSCPSGTDHKGPVCISYSNHYHGWPLTEIYREITYTVYVYPPNGNARTSRLSDFPSL